ncbi:MAG: FAD-dependent oxidoreductase, partial [Gammaproteobacteria bacterium]
VLANAGDAARLGNLASLAVRRVRGQTSWVRDPALAGLRVVLGGAAYAAPAGDAERRALIGASFSESDVLAPDPRDDLGNLRRLGRMLDCDIEAMRGSVAPAATGFRFVLRDRLPAIGPLPDEAAARLRADDLARNGRVPIPLAHGLYGAFGFGSRGLLWASLAAEVLPAMVCGEPAPIESDLLDAIAPGRFLVRSARNAGA